MLYYCLGGAVAQFGSASEWHSEGREFDPPQLHLFSPIYKAFLSFPQNPILVFLGLFTTFFEKHGHKMDTFWLPQMASILPSKIVHIRME